MFMGGNSMRQKTLFEKRQEAPMHALGNATKEVNAKVPPPTTLSVQRNKPPSGDAKVPGGTLQTPVDSA